ncbi:hypothetical protein ANTRET_LOCUS8909 [Anthophora retusa]
MDRSNSCDSNSSSVGGTLEKSPPHFKLHFSKDRLVGKSNIHTTFTTGDSVTPKFYSKKYDNTENDFNTIDDTHSEGRRKQEENDCKYTRRQPLLTSNAYGWWHERGIQPLVSRFDFRKKTSDLVILGTKIFTEDRKFASSKE